MFCNFFSALAPETEEHIKLAKNKLTMTCNVQKVIRALAFRSREKFDKSFVFKIFLV